MKRRYLVLAVLCVLSVILYLDRICISVALPRIQAEFGIPPEQLGWVSLAFSISYAMFEIPSGHMADRTGPRRVLTRIVVWWSTFTALTGVVTGLPSLLVTRFLFVAGEAGAVPNISSAVSRWFPPRARAAAMGATAGAAQVGGALSPLLVVPIQQRYGWRAPFLVFAVVGVLWAVGWYVWFRDTPAETPGISDAEREELAATPSPPSHGLAWRIALRSPSLWGLIVTWFAGIYCGFFGIFWMPTYLVKARGFTEGELRWVAVSWVAGMIGNAGGGFVSDALAARLGLSRGRRVMSVVGMGCLAMGFVGLWQIHDKTTVVVLLALNAIAFGLFQANCLAVCIDIGRSHSGTVTGAVNTAGQLGGAASAVVFGYLVKLSGGYDVPVLVMAVVAFIGTLPWWFIDASRGVVPDDYKPVLTGSPV